MSSEKPHNDPFIEAIEGKIAAWQAVLASYRVAVSVDGPLSDIGNYQSRHAAPEGGKAMDLPVGVFRDKSIKEAIEIYLAAGRRKQANKEIAIGLQKGGIATTSVNFEATVATALSRLKDDGIVLRFPDGWDLAASYPDSLRNRLDKDTKAARPKQHEKKVKPATKSTRTPKRDKTAVILKLISNASDGQNVREVLTAFNLLGIESTKDYIRVVAKRLQKRGLIEVRDGRYYRAQTSSSPLPVAAGAHR